MFVNKGKPIIIAQEGPVDGQVRCIASGYPVPKMSWYFCELPHTRYVQNTVWAVTLLEILLQVVSTDKNKSVGGRLLSCVHFFTDVTHFLVFYLTAPLRAWDTGF